MCNLTRSWIKILCLPLLALPALLLSIPGYADSNTRIHGGIAIDTGDLRLFISDRHIGSYLLFNRYNYDHRAKNHRRNHYHSQGYQSRAYPKAYIYNHYIQPNYRHQSSRDSYHRNIITRDYQRHDQRHDRRHDKRKDRHRRSHNDW